MSAVFEVVAPEIRRRGGQQAARSGWMDLQYTSQRARPKILRERAPQVGGVLPAVSPGGRGVGCNGQLVSHSSEQCSNRHPIRKVKLETKGEIGPCGSYPLLVVEFKSH